MKLEELSKREWIARTDDHKYTAKGISSGMAVYNLAKVLEQALRRLHDSTQEETKQKEERPER